MIGDHEHADATRGGRLSVRDVLVDAERRLTSAGIASPSVDSSSIMAFVLGTTRGRLILQDHLTDEQRLRVEQLISRRLTRVPLQYLLGTAGFRRMEIEVGPGVFIPRPETELVAEAAIRELQSVPAAQRVAVDMCAGSGAIALSMATEADGVRAFAVELSESALVWTRRNIASQQSALAARGSSVAVVEHDAVTVAEGPLAALAGQVAVVVSNPPYIPDAMVPREPEVRDYEPHAALFGGQDGMDVVRGILRSSAILLRPGGLLVLEHADVQGTDAGASGVPGLLRAMVIEEALAAPSGLPAGSPAWTGIQDRTDLNARPRFTLARKRAQ